MDELRAIASWISENYGTAEKIIEVGVGKVPTVAIELRRKLPDCVLIVTDIAEPPELPEGIDFVRDDITCPDVRLFDGAGLVYSIRPPPELLLHLIGVANTAGCDLLVKLTSDEELSGGWSLVNSDGAAFYLMGRT